MVQVRVRYNKYDRTFKLLDHEFGSILEDGNEYDLSVPLMFEDLPDEDGYLLRNVPIAHA